MDRESHRGFLNRYYGLSRHFYDFSRKYYLLGRDLELRALENENWDCLLEIGPGTGRNLKALARRRPCAQLGGLEASDAMLQHARKECPFAQLRQGFAEDANLLGVLGRRPDRILYSYCLSMVLDPRAALQNSMDALAPGGEIVVVDFGDFAGLPRPAELAMLKWLATFHVRPVESQLLRLFGAQLSYGPGRYFVRARIPKS